jgi:predicted dehydrogenase
MAAFRWGVLSTAKIATTKVIPAIRGSEHGQVTAIGSRDGARASEVAEELGIERAYDSYEQVLEDPDIEGVYIPLPNHLHVPWTVRAAEAGKHVLCEKPIGLTTSDAETLLEVADRTGVRIQEAFMVRTHPQWLRARELVSSGEVGELRAIQGFFSYHNTDVDDIRNQADIGGGGMLDIGCYPVTTSRFVLEREPERVCAVVDRDPQTRVDRLGSAILDFSGTTAAFTYGTQSFPYQRMTFVGTQARLDVEIPFNAPSDRPCRLLLTRDPSPGAAPEVIEVPVCDQYAVAADAFVASVRGEAPPPVPLEDSIANMRVLDALLRSAESASWQSI